MIKYYGQFETDKIIETYFPDNTSGTCIEVGAADGIKGSNTLYFEKIGWVAVCIEPIPEYAALCRQRRFMTIECACGEHESSSEPFNVINIGEHEILSSLSSLDTDKRLYETHGHLINKTTPINVEVKALEKIIDSVRPLFPPIDFISIDTEGTELSVLKGINLDKNKIPLLVVENNFNDKEHYEYLKQFGYTLDQRYKINDFYIL